MIDYPENTPKFVVDALNTIDDKSRAMAFDPNHSSDLWRGYFMAVQDLRNEIESQAALERGLIEQGKADAIARYKDQHGKPAS
jgi:hypothetical protein